MVYARVVKRKKRPARGPEPRAETGTGARPERAERAERAPLIRASPGAITLDGPASPLMTVTDLAGYLNVSTKTIKRLVETGSVPSIRIGDTHRFDIHAVRRKIDGGGS